MDVSRYDAKEMRIRFLKKRIASYDSLLIMSLSPVSLLAVSLWKKDCQDEINYLEAKWKQPKNIDNSVTDEMIQAAKDVPIDSIIDFNHGKAIAWCHEDKSPSLMHWRQGNKASCWVCNKKFSTIDAVMHLYGMRFKDAVRQLI
jgi:hypothetical protein